MKTNHQVGGNSCQTRFHTALHKECSTCERLSMLAVKYLRSNQSHIAIIFQGTATRSLSIPLSATQTHTLCQQSIATQSLIFHEEQHRHTHIM